MPMYLACPRGLLTPQGGAEPQQGTRPSHGPVQIGGRVVGNSVHWGMGLALRRGCVRCNLQNVLLTSSRAAPHALGFQCQVHAQESGSCLKG